MPEIKLKARLQNKYETLEEWNQLVKGEFTPLKGEICYGIDKDVLYQKIGDGITDFVDLPWLLNQSDWLENDKTSPTYIQNRIAYTEVVEGDPILEIKYVNNDGISQPIVVSDNVGIICEGREFSSEDIGKLWSFNLKCTNTDGTNPLEINIPGPAELKTFETDGDIIYYYGNFYRFYVMYATIELQDEIAAGDITVEDIEQIVRDELQIEDTNENYAFVNMFGTIIGAVFGVSLDDPSNFNYEFSLSSYPTIVHKLDSKYLEEVNLVGKFEDLDNFSEIFNDYANNRAQSPYSHAEGQQTEVWGSATAAHVEGYKTIASSNYAHAEGENTRAYGTAAHVEGADNEARGPYSHSEGLCTKASNQADHSEGKYTIAQGTSSWGPAHAEGHGTIASGAGAHAEGGIDVVQDYWTEFKEYGYYEYKTNGATCSVASKSKINLSYPINGYPAIIDVYSDERSFQVYNTGELVSGTLSDAIVEAGILNNVYYRIYDDNIGASGDYTHVEGYDNAAIGDYNHVEGRNNFVKGDTNHVGGSSNFVKGNTNYVGGTYNKISGTGHFAFGEGLINNGSTGTSDQIILGRYNQNDEYADLIIGNGTDDNNRRNELILQNGNLQVSGKILNTESDMWETYEVISKTRPVLLTKNPTFEISQFFNKIKLEADSNNGEELKINNGNMLNPNKLKNITLKNGTKVEVDKDYNLIVTAVASEEGQYIDLGSRYFESGTSIVSTYCYCWDETADPEIHYTLGSFVNPNSYQNIGGHLISTNGSQSKGMDLHLFIYIEPNVEKTITLYPPVLGQNGLELDHWIPPMVPIALPAGASLEIDPNNSVFNNRIGIVGYTSKAYKVSVKGVRNNSYINELRLMNILNDQKYNNYENQYIIDLTQEDSNISFIPGTTTLSLSIKLGQKIEGVWTSNYDGITSKQLELVELFPKAMQSLLVGDQNSGFKLPDGIFINNTVDSEWSMPTRALYDLLVGGNIANITDGHVRLEHGYEEFDTCYLKWYIGLGDGTDEEIEALISEIMLLLATATHFVFYLPKGQNTTYLN